MRDLLNKLTLFESTQEGFDPEEFKGEIEDFEVSGDDGEPEGADIHYTAKIVDGKPVVDPKSIEVHAYGNNPSSKLGYDVQNDTDMIMNYGGVDAEEILRSAQEDAEEQYAERDNKYSQGESADESDEQTFEGEEFYEYYGYLPWHEDIVDEAEYQGRKVKLGKPMQGDVKKFKVYVRDPKTKNVKKVNFGDPNMRIKKSNPARRKSFRARHNCDNPGPRTKARYWSCRKW